MEKELKYKLAESQRYNFEQALFANNDFEQYQIEALTDISMHSIYYDSPSAEVSKHAASLRTRRENERELFCLKIDSGGSGALRCRIELEHELSDLPFAKWLQCWPDLEEFSSYFPGTDLTLLSELFLALRGQNLYELGQVQFRRQRCLLRQNQFVAELAYDRGVASIPGRFEEFVEVEAELKVGTESSLLELGKILEKRFGLEFETIGKFGRIVRLRQL